MFNHSINILTLCLAITCCQLCDNAFAQDNSKIRQMPGVALAKASAELSANVPSQLLHVMVKEGQRVSKGQLLAALDYREARAAYDAAKAQALDQSTVLLAKIDVDEYRRKLSRVQNAVASGASNATELESVQYNYERAKRRLDAETNRLKQAQHNADTLRWKLESFLIRAPFDGLVTQLKSNVGNQIQPGQAILELVQYAKLDVELNLPLQLFGKLKTGQTYRLYADAPVSHEIEAELKFVSPIVSSASRTFMAKFEIQNSDFSLPSGFAVKLASDQLNQIAQSSSIGNVPTKRSSYGE